jgi:hypothetical protein
MTALSKLFLLALMTTLLIGCTGEGNEDSKPAVSVPEIYAQTPAYALDDTRQPCRDIHPNKRAFFGALHIHTSLSFDAWVFGNNNGPENAYAFARGEPIFSGPGKLRLDIDRPLDFAAVTDHSEQFAPIGICTDPQQADYDHAVCRTFRGEVWWARLLPDELSRLGRIFSTGGVGPGAVYVADICPGDPTCTNQAQPVWERIQRAAENAYDRSENCEFSTLVAYEYSLTTEGAGNNMHRNVLFKNSTVLNLPVSSRLAERPLDLWRYLDRTCNSADNNCEVLAIPHNSNLSAGEMFTPLYRGATSLAEEAEIASLRARTEPLAEIYQVKGDSECRNNLYGVGGSPDEFCEFEKIRRKSEIFEDCKDEIGERGMAMTGCVSRRSFVRYALTEGLAERQRLGVNPFELGIIAASDSHDSNGGDVDEYENKSGLALSDSDEKRLQPEVVLPGGIASVRQARFAAGGLAGVFAPQNTREDLFDALRNKETFGTSGPRIVPRFFAGPDLPETLCEDSDMLSKAYENGVPMGGTLSISADSPAPTFLVAANADSGTIEHPGGLLQRLQVIKGWVDEDGILQQQVYDVAGDPDNGATVDLANCQPQGSGFKNLCTVWHDPNYDANQQAVYYSRALENPSCRWNAYQCAVFADDERPATCDDPDYPKTIQERAWTSPIWMYPNPGNDASHLM